MMFSVIIPTYHRNDLLANCLERLAPGVQTLPFDKYEVIVTDDGKDTSSESLIAEKYPWVRWLKGPGRGPAANRNHGASYARGEWLVFTDDDCLPDPQWLKEYLKASVKHLECYVFEGRTYADRPRRSFAEIAPINEKGGIMPSCNFMIHKKAYSSVSGFDENFPFNFEDMDFSYRLKKSGWATRFSCHASVCHPWREVDPLKFWRQRKTYKKAYVQFIKKDQEMIKAHNPFFFFKILVKDLVWDTIPNALRFKGKGLLYNLSHRAIHLELFFETLITPTRFFKNKNNFHQNLKSS